MLVDTPDESVLLRNSFAGCSRGLARTFTIMRVLANFGLMRWIMGSQEQSLGLPPALAGVLGAKAGTPRFFRTAVENSNALDELTAELRSSGGFGSLGDRPLSVITHSVPFLGPAAVLEEGWTEGQRTPAALSTNSELIVAAKSNHMINNDDFAVRRTARRCRLSAKTGERSRRTIIHVTRFASASDRFMGRVIDCRFWFRIVAFRLGVSIARPQNAGSRRHRENGTRCGRLTTFALGRRTNVASTSTCSSTDRSAIAANDRAPKQTLLVFHAALQPLDEHDVELAAATVHRDANAVRLQSR